MAPTWGKKIESSDGGQGGNWGKSDNKKVEVHQFGVKKVESSDATPEKGPENETWGKASKSRANKNKSSGTLAWNCSAQAQDSQDGRWNSGGGSSWVKEGGGGGGGWYKDGGDQQDRGGEKG